MRSFTSDGAEPVEITSKTGERLVGYFCYAKANHVIPWTRKFGVARGSQVVIDNKVRTWVNAGWPDVVTTEYGHNPYFIIFTDQTQ